MVVCERACCSGGKSTQPWNDPEHFCANMCMSLRLHMLTINIPWLTSRSTTMTLAALIAEEFVTVVLLSYTTAALLSSGAVGVHNSVLSLNSQKWFLLGSQIPENLLLTNISAHCHHARFWSLFNWPTWLSRGAILEWMRQLRTIQAPPIYYHSHWQ
jgi:hypothetical protein